RIGNEPHVNGIDTRAACEGIDRHVVMSTSGEYRVVGTEYDPATGKPTGRDEIGDGEMPSPPIKSFPFQLDYGDLHVARSLHDPVQPSDRYPRNGKEPTEFIAFTGKPWKDGETYGLGEFNKVGGGARTTDLTSI